MKTDPLLMRLSTNYVWLVVNYITDNAIGPIQNATIWYFVKSQNDENISKRSNQMLDEVMLNQSNLWFISNIETTHNVIVYNMILGISAFVVWILASCSALFDICDYWKSSFVVIVFQVEISLYL